MSTREPDHFDMRAGIRNDVKALLDTGVTEQAQKNMLSSIIRQADSLHALVEAKIAQRDGVSERANELSSQLAEALNTIARLKHLALNLNWDHVHIAVGEGADLHELFEMSAELGLTPLQVGNELAKAYDVAITYRLERLTVAVPRHADEDTIATAVENAAIDEISEREAASRPLRIQTIDYQESPELSPHTTPGGAT